MLHVGKSQNFIIFPSRLRLTNQLCPAGRALTPLFDSLIVEKLVIWAEASLVPKLYETIGGSYLRIRSKYMCIVENL